MSDAKPRVLIVALEIWPAISRLPKTLRLAGFEVEVLCCRDSYLAATRFADRKFFLRSRRFGGKVHRQLVEVIARRNPAFVIPGDDRTVLFFQRLIQLHQEGKCPFTSGLLRILEFSFGNFDWLVEATSKHRTLQRAQALGLRTPGVRRVESLAEAINAARQWGWPVVTKKSTGWGGGGVRFCENESELAAIYHKYREDNRWIGNLKFRLKQLRGWTLGPDWFPADLSVTVNEVIRGNPVMAAAVAVNGKVLAHVAASKLQCYPDAKSPSSVVRFIEHSGIAHAVETLLGHWRATGLIGFDFMLDSRGEASLIECNPRPTCLSYMGPVSGRRLCVALYHYLAGKEMPAPTQPRHEVVAHFPQEWRRDPQSDYLFNAFHDVPWDDPDLMHRLLKDCI